MLLMAPTAAPAPVDEAQKPQTPSPLPARRARWSLRIAGVAANEATPCAQCSFGVTGEWVRAQCSFDVMGEWVQAGEGQDEETFPFLAAAYPGWMHSIRRLIRRSCSRPYCCRRRASYPPLRSGASGERGPSGAWETPERRA